MEEVCFWGQVLSVQRLPPFQICSLCFLIAVCDVAFIDTVNTVKVDEHPEECQDLSSL